MNRNDYLSIENENGVATIWLDQKGSKLNTISPDLIGLVGDVLDELEGDLAVRAIVLASKKKDFIAGADIEAFQRVQKPGDFRPVSEKGHQILNRMANSRKPIVAAIHGTCYGAGLELALACHVRIASNAASTKLALPEVKLGLLPGGGGTQRLPRLIGLQNSLDMMLTGKNIFARKALKIGLVDKLVHKYVLHRAAVSFARKLIDKPYNRKDKRPWAVQLLEAVGPARNLILGEARKMVDKQTKGNYPAPYEILKCVEVGLNKGMEAGIKEEIDRFEKLILSPESRQLINIFFAMTAKKKNPMKDLVRPIDRLGMLGAGFMGAGIAEVSINKDIQVVMKDIKQESLNSAKQTIWKGVNKKIKRKILSKAEGLALINKVQGSLDYEDFASSDIVVEAVFEDLNLKKRVLADCEAVTRDDCIFASNTSALPIKAIAEGAKRPELVIGMHYFSPVPKMPLLEIVKTDQTADWVVATCLELGIRQGKTCIVVKDGPGFYTTRILAPFMNEALLLLEEGGKIDQIDRALQKYGYPVGPITLMDEVGIDVGAHIMSGDLMKHFLSQRKNIKISDSLVHIYKAGYSGRKNKKGFYLYDEKTGKKLKGKINEKIYDFFGGAERKDLPLEEMQLRPALVMVNEAARCLEEGIIESPLDGDIGAIFGIGFPPFRGGPFRFVDVLGAETVVNMMEELAQKHGSRFLPADILRDYAETGKKFYQD